MRLRRKPPILSTSRRQRVVTEDNPITPKFIYRARRTEEELNTGRQTARETVTAASGTFRKFMLQRFGLLLLLVALVISLVNVLSLSTEVRVLPLVAGNNIAPLHEEAVYQEAAAQMLDSSIWNRNKVTINTARINQQMLQRFPELSDVSITLPLLNKRPIVYLQTVKPAIMLVTRDGSFVIGESGKALAPASSLSHGSDLKLPLVTDQSGLAVVLNRQALSSDNMRFIQTITRQLAARHFTITSMLLPTASSELDVRVANQPYLLKFNLESGEARQQVGTFLATQAKLQSQNITPAEYVDVRVEGRAYYK